MDKTMELNQIIDTAKQDFHDGKFKQAIQGFETALETLRSEGKTLEAAEMANNLSVAYLQNKNKTKALEIVEGTDQIFAENGDVVKQAMALGNQAAALEALKRFDEAEQAYQSSADLLEETGEQELRGYVLQSLSALQLRRGRQIDGLISMKSGLDGQEKLSLRQRFLRWILKIPFKFVGK
jgi:tetratricopeptide (TPR) repeat protein